VVAIPWIQADHEHFRAPGQRSLAFFSMIDANDNISTALLLLPLSAFLINDVCSTPKNVKYAVLLRHGYPNAAKVEDAADLRRRT